MKSTITNFVIDRKAYTVTAGGRVFKMIAARGNYWIATCEGKEYHLFPKGADREAAMLLIDVEAFNVVECVAIDPVIKRAKTSADWLFK